VCCGRFWGVFASLPGRLVAVCLSVPARRLMGWLGQWTGSAGWDVLVLPGELAAQGDAARWRADKQALSAREPERAAARCRRRARRWWSRAAGGTRCSTLSSRSPSRRTTARPRRFRASGRTRIAGARRPPAAGRAVRRQHMCQAPCRAVVSPRHCLVSQRLDEDSADECVDQHFPRGA